VEELEASIRSCDDAGKDPVLLRQLIKADCERFLKTARSATPIMEKLGKQMYMLSILLLDAQKKSALLQMKLEEVANATSEKGELFSSREEHVQTDGRTCLLPRTVYYSQFDCTLLNSLSGISNLNRMSMFS
jgi:hypothetical protein